MRPSPLPSRDSAKTTVSPSVPGPMTEFTLLVYRNLAEHKIRLGEVAKWDRTLSVEDIVKYGKSRLRSSSRHR